MRIASCLGFVHRLITIRAEEKIRMGRRACASKNVSADKKRMHSQRNANGIQYDII